MRAAASAICIVVATLCLSAAPANAAGWRAKAASACPGATIRPDAVSNLPRVRSAIVCLLNRERARRGHGRLRSHPKLRRAAERHSRNMSRHDFFSHVTPGGATVVERAAAAGYLAGAERWALGENLAWGTGGLATPLEITRSWLDSRGHYRNIMNRKFRHVGVGVVAGTPEGAGSSGATYTITFGARR